MAATDETVKVTERLDEATAGAATEQSSSSNDTTSESTSAAASVSQKSTENVASEKQAFDAIIAVMGQTGVGKTSFISRAVGKDLNVGHDIFSCTQDVEQFDTIIDGHKVRLIDTPGFDDSDRSDTDILRLISYYLDQAYKQRILLTGVIYMQRISDNRAGGSTMRNIRLLKKLVGEDNFQNIALVTTMWDLLPEKELGVRREKQLISYNGFWAGLIEKRASVHRHLKTEEDSAIKIIRSILLNSPMVLQFQKELAKYGHIGQTSAGEEVIIYLAKVSQDYEQKIKELHLQIRELQEAKSKREAMELQLANLIAANSEALKKNEEALDERARLGEELREEKTKRQAMEKEIAALTKENEEQVKKNKEALDASKQLSEDLIPRLNDVEDIIKKKMGDKPRSNLPQCAIQ